MCRSLWMVPVAVLFTAGLAAAQNPSNPPAPPQSVTLSEGLKRAWASVKQNVVEAAEKMPEANYSFKPTPEVRSFGEVVGHIAQGNYIYCTRVTGEAPPKTEFEKLATKAELVKALKESVAACDAVITPITDDALTQKVKAGNNEMAKGIFVAGVIAHANEHYGNQVTYLRLKGLVPPSTERAMAPKKPSSQN
jgi:uncharacterized damage-inducible protein DinB